MLLHLIDGTQKKPGESYKTVRHELAEYGADLSEKTEIVALNKCDALNDELINDARAELEDASGKPVLTISGVSGAGVTDALRQLAQEVARRKAAEVAKTEEPVAWSP